MKRILYHLRKSFKLILILLAGAILIGTLLYFLYKPMYAVYIDGELVGYTENKSNMQDKINQYVKNGDGKNIAFYEIDTMPVYETCYSKKDLVADDKKIFDTIIANSTPYYKQYAILLGKEEKYYVSDYKQVEKIIGNLKSKKSTNIKKISYTTKYSPDKKQEETSGSKIVSSLYVKPKKKKIAKKKTSTFSSGKARIIASSRKSSSGFIFPVAGCSVKDIRVKRYPSYYGHTGVDVNSARAKRSSVVAAKSGKVIVSEAKISRGRYYSYGEYIVIQHSDGKQTLYAHMRPGSRTVSVGDIVKQGQVIGRVGSTGNSTGAHLHFEVKVGGRPVNPFNYLY